VSTLCDAPFTLWWRRFAFRCARMDLKSDAAAPRIRPNRSPARRAAGSPPNNQTEPLWQPGRDERTKGVKERRAARFAERNLGLGDLGSGLDVLLKLMQDAAAPGSLLG
jgi:hypothetical protein